MEKGRRRASRAVQLKREGYSSWRVRSRNWRTSSRRGFQIRCQLSFCPVALLRDKANEGMYWYCDVDFWRPLPLIFALHSDPGIQVGVSARTKSAPPTRAFLEKRVQQLEGSLESKDKECTRKLRALQQKYIALEVQLIIYYGDVNT